MFISPFNFLADLAQSDINTESIKTYLKKLISPEYKEVNQLNILELKLEKLEEIREKGLVSEEEYQEMRNQILGL